jgi:hypothetical protein
MRIERVVSDSRITPRVNIYDTVLHPFLRAYPQVMRKHTAFIRRYPNGTMDRLAGPAAPVAAAGAEGKLKSIDVDGLPRVGELVEPDKVGELEAVSSCTRKSLLRASLTC